MRAMLIFVAGVVAIASRGASGAFGVGEARAEAVYAAFTVNLTRFITWPDRALGPTGAPLLIGTFPHDPINRDLDAAVLDETVSGHPLRTIRLQSLDDIRKCHVVFFSHGVADPATVLAQAGHRPILTVSDAEEFLALGGQVRFVPKPPHTRLRISADNLHASGLEARAQLLRLATMP